MSFSPWALNFSLSCKKKTAASESRKRNQIVDPCRFLIQIKKNCPCIHTKMKKRKQLFFIFSQYKNAWKKCSLSRSTFNSYSDNLQFMLFLFFLCSVTAYFFWCGTEHLLVQMTWLFFFPLKFFSPFEKNNKIKRHRVCHMEYEQT